MFSGFRHYTRHILFQSSVEQEKPPPSTVCASPIDFLLLARDKCYNFSITNLRQKIFWESGVEMRMSVEEQVEDRIKQILSLNLVKYYTKTELINDEIEEALKKYPSKSGGGGTNYPDIKLLIETSPGQYIPVVIEVKGIRGRLIKKDKRGDIVQVVANKSGNEDWSAVKNYAVNGAIHYAKAILEHTHFESVIAIGVNGYKEANELQTELEAYYIANQNDRVALKITNFNSLELLANSKKVNEHIEDLRLSPEEKRRLQVQTEEKLDMRLRSINQMMQDTLQINVNHRVNLVAGLIMAGLGTSNVPPLASTELRGLQGKNAKDGSIVAMRISDFLDSKNLPEEKREMILRELKTVFLDAQLSRTNNGESKIKSLYRQIERDILPLFRSEAHIDFTGKLFNVLNEWVNVPDGDKNDVVLTPRYITELMAQLCHVNMDSYVWDYAAGSAGFLVSSMKLMLEDAREKIADPAALQEKESHIKQYQLLGVEKLSDIYLLAILNMILMGDGSSNIIHADSLSEYSGNYEQGEKKSDPFPANVFLLNPPYSAPGKGLIFAEKAMRRMKSGYAAILIQENAGSGNGLEYAKKILSHSTLIASIHMADIFSGKASVQTSIYLFEVGRPHDIRDTVKFIDFSYDGYTRQNRKKSSQEVNLKDTDQAKGRYQELVDVVHYGRRMINLIGQDNYIEDTISLEGNDWTFRQHKPLDTTPRESDFLETINEYLEWKIDSVMKRKQL